MSTGTTTLKMIVAMTRNGGIGKNGKIPWHYPQDLKRFRQLTNGHPIIMGRKTWQSLPKKPLPNRLNIILTRSPDTIKHISDDIEIARTPEEAISIVNQYHITNDSKNPIAWVIGGQVVYETFIHHPLLNHIDCTIIPENHDCDTFFSTIPDTFILDERLFTPVNNGTQLIHHCYSRD